jgi:GNAT superfamily N-acetyltransferase
MRKIITSRPMEDGSMIQFRKAVTEDIPKLIKLFKETILEVYGQILPGEVLKP